MGAIMVINNRILNIVFCSLVLLYSVIFISGCAISGCGNPASNTDSNNNVEYAHDDQSIIINNSERTAPQKVRKPRFKRKRYEPI